MKTPRRAGLADADAFAAIHALCFTEPWSALDFATLLVQPGMGGWLWGTNGLLLVRAAADEAEILTLGVVPAARGKGGGLALIDAAFRGLGAGGTKRLFLEVATDNQAALNLYRRTGFAQCGLRPAYYERPTQAGGRADALIMEKILAADS